MQASENSDLLKFDQLLSTRIVCAEDQLADVLSSVLSGVDHAKTGALHTHSGIFWALTRVFGCYERLASAYEDYAVSPADDLTFFSELDAEHFVMRLRVLLDEFAYGIRIRLPDRIRGLGKPEGPGPLSRKHFSMTKLQSFVEKQPRFSPILTELIRKNNVNINKFIERRDDVVHFKAKAIIYRGDRMSVEFIGARTSQEPSKERSVDLLEYVTDATIWIWGFMQRDLVEYFRRRIESGELKFAPLGIGPHKIGMPGITRFKKLLSSRSSL